MTFFNATPGNDTFTGGILADTVSYASASAGVKVSLAIPGPQNTGGSGIDTLTSIEALIGSSFGDNLSGSNANDTIDGGAGVGSDTMAGGLGTDTVSYKSATSGVNVKLSISGALQDTGGAGFDQLSGFENLTGSDFNDTLSGDGGSNVLNGGAGTDTVSYANATGAVTVSLGIAGAQNTVGAGTDTLSGFENLRGSNFNDTLSGDAGDNVLNGGAGADTVSYGNALAGVTVSLSNAAQQNTGGAGLDTLSGFENLTGSGLNDTLSGDGGNNVLKGGAGADTVSYANAAAGVTVSLGNAAQQNTGGAGLDTLSGFENLTGSKYADRLTGDGLANTIDGGSGNDTLVASGGVDRLSGGGGGFWRFSGGLIGGGFTFTSYVDRFVFNAVADSPNGAPDVITDYDRGIGEKIDVSGIDANTLVAGNQAFTWVGNINFNPAILNRGELGYQVSGADLMLIGNTANVSGTPDFRVQLQGAAATGIISSDVIL